MSVVLFDLDNTLVATSKLQEIRESGDYEGLTEEKLATSFVYKPVRRMLEALQEKGVRLGIVSNGGRTYVDRVLKFHGLSDFFDVVVTYTDVKAAGKKPKPDGIVLASKLMGVDLTPDVLFVGDHTDDIEAAYRAGVKPVVPSWASRKPTSLAPAFEAASSQLINYFENPSDYFLLAERAAATKSFSFARKAVYFLPLDTSANVVTVKGDMRVFCLGRYFSQKTLLTATIHDKHALSLEIAKKNEPKEFVPPAYWKEMLAHVVNKGPEWLFERGAQFDVVTVIPSKEGKPRRMEKLLADVANVCANLPKAPTFNDRLLTFARGTRDQKTLTRYERTTEALSLGLAPKVDVKGKRVLVIDDVVTTGSTMSRALDVLTQAGAADVFGLAIAKTVSIPESEKQCPKCAGSMNILKHSKTGQRFWSCSNFRNEAAKCKYTESIDPKYCAACAREMRLFVNGKTGEKFWSCTGYKSDPACNRTEPYRQ
jgi:HAD superfamily phosphatase (TIGR01681 family)